MLGLLPATGAFSQDSRYTESDLKLLQECRSLFNGGDYAAASDYLKMCNARGTASEENLLLREELEYMSAVVEFQQNPLEGRDVFQKFMEKYPSSVWNNRLKALTGISCAMRGEYSEALVWFDDCDVEKLGVADSRKKTFYNALALIRCGRMTEGYVMLSELGSMGGYDDEVLFYKSCVDYAEGRTDEAKSGFSRSLRLPRYADLSQMFLAEIALGEGRTDEAVRMAESLLDSENNSVAAESERIIGSARYIRGEWQDAADLLSSYVMGDTEPDRLDIYQLGMANWQLGNDERALQFLGDVSVKDDVLEQNAWYHIGLSALKAGNTGDAILAFEQVASMTSDRSLSEMGLYNYAMAVQNSGYSPFAEPVRAFERFLNEYPDSKYADKVNDAMADVLMQSGNYDEALEALAKIKNPSRRLMEVKQQLLFRKGVELYAGSEYDRVPEYMTKVIDMSSYNKETAAQACFWRAETYFREGKFSQAASDYNRFFGLTGDSKSAIYSQALYGSGYCAYRASDWAKAIGQFSELTDRHKTAVQKDMLGDAFARLGDCYFYRHEYDKAENSYEQSLSYDRQNGDYALYRMGLVKGLKKDYKGKVSMLERLCSEYPSSAFTAQALFEEARAYQQMDNSSSAVNSFEKIVAGYPKSDLARKASAEIALIYYQNDNFDKAIPAYKKVIETYPGSEEAATAVRDLRSIYVETGQVDQYLAYSESVAGAASVGVDERDSLTYISAERMFTRGEFGSAEAAFENYLHQFPEGAYIVNANYYLGSIYNDNKEYDKALTSWLKAAGNDNSRFCTEALERAASLAYSQKQYGPALEAYRRLYERGASAEYNRSAALGVVRSAYLVDDFETAADFADKAVAAKLDADQITEVRYIKAKSLLALNRTDAALSDFRDLSSDTRSVYGAESSWQVSNLLFKAGDMDGAEKNIKELISAGTPHAYWLARSFILLSDVYLAQDRQLEARQYLLSLKQNYKEDDDIAPMIGERLAKMD